MYSTYICTNCGALVAFDYWSEHEKYHKQRNEKCDARHSISIVEAGDDPQA